MKLKALIASALILVTGAASAGDWEFTGFVGADGRAFLQDHRYPEQESGLNMSLIAQPELYWQDVSGDHRFAFVGFGRLDSEDDERTHADIRELFWGYSGDGWDTVIGFNRVFWGVTESQHLVDVINQTDLVEDIDQEDKLGQPMVNVNLDSDFGRFEFFVMPYFRERTFPGVDGRLRPPLPVDTDNAQYESSDEQNHTDFSLRYSHYFGDVDIGLSVFDGTSREPLLLLAPEGDRLIPFYQQMTQAGLDLQYTTDAWLWKLEAIHRDTSTDDFFATVAGFEYTKFGIGGSAADLGFLLEYLYDGRGEQSPPTSFDNDIFLGTRLALNDAEDTSVLAGVAVDLDTQETFFNIEAERRFGDQLSASLRVRAFTNAEEGDVFYAFSRDDYIQLRLDWYY